MKRFTRRVSAWMESFPAQLPFLAFLAFFCGHSHRRIHLAWASRPHTPESRSSCEVYRVRKGGKNHDDVAY